MTTEPEGNTLGKVLSAYPNIVKNVYKDGASSAVQQTGVLLTELVKTVRLVLAPIQFAAHAQDRLDAYLRQAIGAIPKERQVVPPTTLTIALVEKLKFQDEGDQLTQLYIELLRRACDRDRATEAHPAFVNIIPQLSPDEAVVLYYICRGGSTGKYFLSAKKGAMNSVFNHLVCRDVEQPKATKGGFTMKSSAVIGSLFPLERLLVPKYIDMYLSHLKSLNLVEPQRSPGVVSFHESESDREMGRLQRRDLARYKLSLFGELFAKACIPEDFDLPTRGAKERESVWC